MKEYKLIKPSHSLGKWATEFLRPLTKASNRFRSVNSVGGYRVYIIADDELINAFAAPGGYTYISSGLILAADNCAEIAGVMGHELAHVTERHSVKKLESAMAVQTASGVLLGEGFGVKQRKPFGHSSKTRPLVVKMKPRQMKLDCKSRKRLDMTRLGLRTSSKS